MAATAITAITAIAATAIAATTATTATIAANKTKTMFVLVRFRHLTYAVYKNTKNQ
jgi:hypothetical protein